MSGDGVTVVTVIVVAVTEVVVTVVVVAVVAVAVVDVVVGMHDSHNTGHSMRNANPTCS
jgi:hypothetical protein